MLKVQDHYFKQAKKEGYVARSAFKLQEIDQKFQLFWPKTTHIIDIGCAPGSRLQYASQRCQYFHPSGKHDVTIVWFDLKKVMIHLPYVTTYQQDVTEKERVREILNAEFTMHNDQWWLSHNEDQITKSPNLQNTKIDLIISDMAPDTLGDKGTDALRSVWLIYETMWMYEELLDPDGSFAIKVFMWPGFDDLVRYCRERRWAKTIHIFKPKSCRKESKEIYIVRKMR